MTFKYSKKEALDRIVRILIGSPESGEEPDINLQGALRSEDDSVSDIANILADTLPGYNATLPVEMKQDYGEIYAWTGTATMTGLSASAYTKVTGTFQNSGYNDRVTCTPASDRMTLTNTGYWFVDWQLSFQGSPDITYKFEPYHAALGMPQAAAEITPNASGSVQHVGGCGIFIASGSSEAIDLRVICSATGWLIPRVAQLRVFRMHKPY